MLKNKGACFKACAECEIPFRDSIEDNIDELDIEKFKYNNEI